MELPRRHRGDELLKPGALLNLRSQLRRIAHGHDPTTVIACAFDRRRYDRQPHKQGPNR